MILNRYQVLWNKMMTVRHFTFLESFYDIFEFTSKLKQQEKQEK